jgi:hypothetical protein
MRLATASTNAKKSGSVPCARPKSCQPVERHFQTLNALVLGIRLRLNETAQPHAFLKAQHVMMPGPVASIVIFTASPGTASMYGL